MQQPRVVIFLYIQLITFLLHILADILHKEYTPLSLLDMCELLITTRILLLITFSYTSHYEVERERTAQCEILSNKYCQQQSVHSYGDVDYDCTTFPENMIDLQTWQLKKQWLNLIKI